MNSTSNLMVSISGIRGTIPDGLGLENLLEFSRTFADTLNPNRIILGRDSRPSGEFIEHFLTGIFLSLGIDVWSVGIVPTPTVKSAVKVSKSNAGIMISASHNPIQWNALKLIQKDGFFLSQDNLDKFLLNLKSERILKPSYLPESEWQERKDMIHSHFDSVLKNFDIIKIKKKKFTVLLDAVNGAGSIVVSDFLKFLGCKVVEINCIPNGKFPRPPEPTPTALQKTSAIMKKSGADIGFALDPDADRLVVLTPKRGSISEEYTLPLSLLSAVKKYKGNSIVINLSTSFINDQILLPFRKRVLRAKVGEANVVQMMLEDNSFFGGEGNGGVIDPKVTSFGRDSLTGIAHILNLLTEEKKSIDEIVNRLPEIHLDKTAIPIKPEISKEKIFENAIKTFPEAKVDSRDGLRLDLGNAWVHLRASNTEPIIRIICEAKSKEDLKALLKKTTQLVGS